VNYTKRVFHAHLQNNGSKVYADADADAAH